MGRRFFAQGGCHAGGAAYRLMRPEPVEGRVDKLSAHPLLQRRWRLADQVRLPSAYRHPSIGGTSKATGCSCSVRDTERVLQCQVLRCQERATRNFVIDQGESGLFETLVCEVHAAALKAGKRYVYNSVENVIYMGRDAPPPSR
jgi:hypothetical protein